MIKTVFWYPPIVDFARAMSGETPVKEFFDANHEIVILGRVPKDDDDPLHSDLDFQMNAKAKTPGKYPELPRVSLPCGYLTKDDNLPYGQHLVGRVGQSGWNYVEGTVAYVPIEFNLLEPHKHQTTGITAEEMGLVEAALKTISCCQVNRSTSGNGLHVRVLLLNSVKVADRKGYQAVIRKVLSLLDEMHELPFKLADKVDQTALGRGVLWMWAHEMNDRSFELVSAATDKLDLGVWAPEETKATKKPSAKAFEWKEFLERNNVSYTTKPYDKADDGVGYCIACLAKHEKLSDTKTMLWSQDGQPYGKCLADKCAGTSGQDFIKMLAPNDPIATRTSAQWAVTTLLSNAESSDEFFHDDADVPYVQCSYKGSAVETYTVGSTKYRDCLRRRFRDLRRGVINESNLSLVTAELETYARLCSSQHEVKGSQLPLT